MGIEEMANFYLNLLVCNTVTDTFIIITSLLFLSLYEH